MTIDVQWVNRQFFWLFGSTDSEWFSLRALAPLIDAGNHLPCVFCMRSLRLHGSDIEMSAM